MGEGKEVGGVMGECKGGGINDPNVMPRANRRSNLNRGGGVLTLFGTSGSCDARASIFSLRPLIILSFSFIITARISSSLVKLSLVPTVEVSVIVKPISSTGSCTPLEGAANVSLDMSMSLRYS